MYLVPGMHMEEYSLVDQSLKSQFAAKLKLCEDDDGDDGTLSSQ